MKYLGITPVDEFNGMFVKREDLAHWSSLDYPSGSKVRQYMAMAKPNYYMEDSLTGPPPCLVGCSANSAMAIYVASTAKILGTKGIIYTAKRKVRSAGITYALSLGAEVNEMTSKQGYYLSHLQRHAKQRGIDLKNYIMWDRNAAIQDTIDQCVNIPVEIKRIIVPTGSGLTAAGVLLGINKYATNREKYQNLPVVVAVGASAMSDYHSIMTLARKMNPMIGSATLEFIGPDTPYDTPVVESLPDGTPLDPFYAAKAWKYLEEGDLFWPVGLRPIISMPEICRESFKDWKGPD
jgi:hypothetical protein